jgi:hypothetical protein
LDTVDFETPAAAATSKIVGGFRSRRLRGRVAVMARRS